jgi:hypothetical protein
MVGNPPNCQCPSNAIPANGTCQACGGGRVAVNGQCQCPKGTGAAGDKCEKCQGGRKTIDGVCKCPKGKIAWPYDTSKCVAGDHETCVFRGTAPFCEGSCQRGELEKGRARNRNDGVRLFKREFGKDCVSGSKALCCYPE